MKTMRGFAVAGLIAVATLPTVACLNEYRRPVDAYRPPKGPTPPGPDSVFEVINGHGLPDWTAREKKLRPTATAANAPMSAQSDYAVALLHLGRTAAALDILKPLAQRNPKEYRIIANLGTAYELAGDLPAAHTNITKAILLNPASHDGTEWLHLKILEAKMELAKNPQWLQTHSVIGQSFGSGAAAVMPVELKGSSREIARTRKAMLYQLRERLQFVRGGMDAPEVADLLFDLGNFYGVQGSPDMAVAFYQTSLIYGNLRKSLIDSRLAYYQPRVVLWRPADTTLNVNSVPQKQ